MQALTGASSHLLLNRKDNPASHSTRREQSGPASAFSTHSFGPMDLPDGNNGAAIDGTKKSGASNSSVAAVTGGSVGWLTQLAVSKGY